MAKSDEVDRSGDNHNNNNNKKKADEAAANTSATHPACDQCRSRKVRCDRKTPCCSNCRKANLSCDFHNKSKRVNHTKQLVEDFSTLSNRLESIDSAIAKIHQRLEGDTASTTTSTRSDTRRSSVLTNDDLDYFAKRDAVERGATYGDDASLCPDVPRSHRVISLDSKGTETFYGPTSARSLFQNIRTIVQRFLHAESVEEDADDMTPSIPSSLARSEAVRASMKQCEEAYPFPRVCSGTTISGDGRSLSRPPQTFLEAAVDFFLQEINPVLPLFDENALRNAMQEHYNGPRNASTDAWNLCFNNIIVLSMGLKLKTAVSMKVHRRDLDEDIFLPFLVNSQRAFDSLADYYEPRLVNVQAIATLALVAADHLPYGTFEKLIHEACTIARDMGLQHNIQTGDVAPSAIDLERRRVFWSLYVLDKRRAFITGKSCDIYLFESDLETPAVEDSDSQVQYSLARIHIMSVWEEIWINLYSSRSLRNATTARRAQVQRLEHHLKDWVAQHKSLLCKPECQEDSTTVCMRLELRYCYHIAQILVHRCADHSENSQLQQLNHARAALRVVSDVFNGPTSNAGIALLSRLFRCYPILPCHVLQTRLLCTPDADSTPDMELLQTCIKALRIFVSPISRDVYHNKVLDGMEWCHRAVNIVRQGLLDTRQSTLSSRQPSVSDNVPPKLGRAKRYSECVEADLPAKLAATDLHRVQRRRISTPMSNGHGHGTDSNSNSEPATPPSIIGHELAQLDQLAMDSNLSMFSLHRVTKMPAEAHIVAGLPLHGGPAAAHSTSLAPTQHGVHAFDMPFDSDASFFMPFAAADAKATTAAHAVASHTEPVGARLKSASEPVPRSTANRSYDLPILSPTMPEFTPGAFSTFDTDLLHDSFVGGTNVMVPQSPKPMLTPSAGMNISHWDFDFSPDRMDFSHMDDMMNINPLRHQ